MSAIEFGEKTKALRLVQGSYDMDFAQKLGLMSFLVMKRSLTLMGLMDTAIIGTISGRSIDIFQNEILAVEV